MIWEGNDVIATSRKMIGATNPAVAELGTIRGDLGLTGSKNCIHGSDSIESAKREISIWFKPEEIMNYADPLEH